MTRIHCWPILTKKPVLIGGEGKILFKNGANYWFHCLHFGTYIVPHKFIGASCRKIRKISTLDWFYRSKRIRVNLSHKSRNTLCLMNLTVATPTGSILGNVLGKLSSWSFSFYPQQLKIKLFLSNLRI